MQTEQPPPLPPPAEAMDVVPPPEPEAPPPPVACAPPPAPAPTPPTDMVMNEAAPQGRAPESAFGNSLQTQAERDEDDKNKISRWQIGQGSLGMLEQVYAMDPFPGAHPLRHCSPRHHRAAAASRRTPSPLIHAARAWLRRLLGASA